MNTGVIKSSWIGMSRAGRMDAGFWTQITAILAQLDISHAQHAEVERTIKMVEGFEDLLKCLPKSFIVMPETTEIAFGSIGVEHSMVPETWVKPTDPAHQAILDWVWLNNVRYTFDIGRRQKVTVWVEDKMKDVPSYKLGVVNA